MDVKFGPVFRALREEKGLSLSDFARLAGVSVSMVSMVELCRRPPPPNPGRWAQVLGLSPEKSGELTHMALTERQEICPTCGTILQ